MKTKEAHKDKIYNKRFIKVYNLLRKRGVINSKSCIARALGTYHFTIGEIIKGQRSLTMGQMHKLMKAYGVSANYLFGRSENVFASSVKGYCAPCYFTYKVIKD